MKNPPQTGSPFHAVSFVPADPSLFSEAEVWKEKAQAQPYIGQAQCEERRAPAKKKKGVVALHWIETTIVKRSEGKNVIARAAYNARERLVDERTNVIYDYRHLSEPEWRGILYPESAPDWVTDRGQLWNAVEKTEDRSKHRDTAQLARDFKIALPEELDPEQRLALTKDYAAEMTRKGMVVDVAIHAPHAHSSERNYHFHMLATMREIGPEGFGNKVREWNQKAEFNRWMERWSELGADHLERAGFQQEADRFRDGHLSRRERARRAHERGDLSHFERLLNEPERHRGPAASAMERNGKRTRQGDINREIQARNRVQGIPREIRQAYYLSVDPDGFVAALEKKDMVLARITEKDAASKAAEFAIEDRYVRQYGVGDYVVVTEKGHEYRLGPMVMGDSTRGIAAFMKSHGGKDCPSLEEANAEIKRRSLIPKVDRDEVIEKMMRNTKTVHVPVSDLPQHIQAQYEDPMSATLPKIVLQPKDHPRTALPYGADMPQVRGEAAQVWWAYNSIRSPEDLQKSLESRGLTLARVTVDDASASKTQHWAAMRLGRYHPILHEGQYLAVSDAGRIYQFNDRTLGHEVREIKVFMGRLDDKPMPSLREAQNAVQEKRQKEIAASNHRSLAEDLPGRESASLRRIVRGTERMVGVAFEFVANGFESLFSRSISPEERTLAEVTQHEMKAAGRRAKRDRGDDNRER